MPETVIAKEAVDSAGTVARVYHCGGPTWAYSIINVRERGYLNGWTLSEAEAYEQAQAHLVAGPDGKKPLFDHEVPVLRGL
jgi:hypothetical protein